MVFIQGTMIISKLNDFRHLTQKVHMTLIIPVCLPQEASCAYVLIVTAIYWVSEAVPLGAAALIPAFLYPLFGVMKSSEVAAEYVKNTTLLLIGVICVAASVEKWNLHKRIALRMVMMAGAKPGMLLLCFMCCTTTLSMWLSNTSTTAMVMPIVEAVLQELVKSEEDHEMNGTAGSTIREEKETISLGDKHGQGSLDSNGHLNPFSKQQYPSKHDHMICKCLSLSISYAATIGGLTTIIGTSTNLIFLEYFNNHYPNSDVVNFGTWFLFSLPISLIMLVLTWFWMHWLFLGCNFKETCSISKKKKTKREEMSEKRIQEEYEKLGNISYPEMMTAFFFILMTLLWFTREPGFIPGWSSFFEQKGYRTDATVSVFLGFLLFLIPAKKPCFGKKTKGMKSIITWKDFEKTMPWEIVVLVGGGYALAAGCKTSGLSTWIGRQMLSLSSLPSWAVSLLACLLVSMVTEFVSNPATITIFLPILCAMSESLQINPLYTLIPVTMCISFAVMIPVGNPPNAIVFTYGHCKIKDMIKAGFGVNIIGLVIVTLAINTWGIKLFQLDIFPDWAQVSNNITVPS
uniref:Solute carrier family 13 member 4 n=1 Tax=Pseudonaja textilis TaxID=8673 RepID=A0A670YDF5_PSETE